MRWRIGRHWFMERGERCLAFCTSYTPDVIYDLEVTFDHHSPNTQVKLFSCLLIITYLKLSKKCQIKSFLTNASRRHSWFFNYSIDKGWLSTEISAGWFAQVSQLIKILHSFYAQEVKNLWKGLKKLAVLFEANNVKMENVKIKFP